ncbi:MULTISPECIES: ribonuclease Y [unclassified Fusibacter]|uniref:ribonuclease Y n=1 Tax=unclassified Fusibacter TaxID=2624464 RepID=UPI001013571C|nr:ribonuclease Y [Fusibacter sp. A1]MCK8058855.1 ribonuclease Y [Fusibacter sp. A2]NPE21929.1 ribonuclease Y [Fusibacter sp. A1]RXV61499.1 ribonuclease Y [Fusibacter sp. A1]
MGGEIINYPLVVLIAAIIFGPLGGFIGYTVRKNIAEGKIKSAEIRAAEIVTEAKKMAEAEKKLKVVEAKDEVHQLRIELDRETKERRAEIQNLEKRNLQKEEQLDKKSNNLEKREESLQKRQSSLDKKENSLEELEKQHILELEKVSGMTSDEAKRQLLADVEKDVQHDAVILIKEAEGRVKEESNKRARDIISTAIQRCAADHVAESTVSVVDLPNDEMKGRIIGREGRNIRALETLTGVDLIIDDTPEAVILSSFDPIRRETARIALEKLIQDGRIHPARIEEMVEKAKKEIDQRLKEAGENATFEVGIHNLHPELVKLLGRLHFRTSYGQNVLKHSIEVAQLSGIMAAELGVDTRIAKRAGLLHDIGKAVDHEVEGTHIEIGMNLLKRFKESKAVIHAMSTHHGDYEPESIEAILVTAADALSAARPGARRETLNTYIKRLEALETISNSYDGVEKCFAIQAGREVRIMVVPEKITDDEMVLMGREIRKRIEEELDYPGQIKVSMIRESRSVEYAK